MFVIHTRPKHFALVTGLLIALLFFARSWMPAAEQSGQRFTDTGPSEHLVLPPPFATRSVANPPNIVEWPSGKKPVAPATRSSWVTLLLVGLAVLFGFEIVSQVLRSSDGGFLYGLGQTIRVVVKTAWVALMMVGFGSFVLTRLGSRTMPAQAWSFQSSPGAPPPPPSTPSA